MTDIPTQLAAIGQSLADVLGDGMTAMHTGGHFTCAEADAIGAALVALGQPDAAAVWIEGHAEGDDEEDSDDHHHIKVAGPEAQAALAKAYVEANL